MWFISFVLAVGALISLLVFGSAAYLESSGAARVTRALNGPVPLPKARPVSLVKQLEETEVVKQPPLPKQNLRRTKLRGGW
jgi:hypothetical protein